MTEEIKRPAGAVFRVGQFVFADGGVIMGQRLVLVYDTEGNEVDRLPLGQAKAAYADEFDALRVWVSTKTTEGHEDGS
jgi:hypothetical protein